ncbi:MAG: HPr family phosphocarrier protein [Ruthenibacterium sp.]
MVKQVKITNFTEVKSIMNAATKCQGDIGVHDMKGSIADAKSILGLMSLDYTQPVMLVSENESELEHVYKSLS